MSGKRKTAAQWQAATLKAQKDATHADEAMQAAIKRAEAADEARAVAENEKTRLAGELACELACHTGDAKRLDDANDYIESLEKAVLSLPTLCWCLHSARHALANVMAAQQTLFAESAEPLEAQSPVNKLTVVITRLGQAYEATSELRSSQYER
jgi:hypothetical protein